MHTQYTHTQVLLERCLVALRTHENRQLMLKLLREAKGGHKSGLYGGSGSGAGGTIGAVGGQGMPAGPLNMQGYSFGAAGNTSPLNYAAFEALTICFLEILQHCVDCNDYR